MRTVSYDSILNGVAAIAGIDPANVLVHEKTIFAEYINNAVKLCWDYYPWQEFTITEERYFRDEFNASSVYSVGDEIYYKEKYYRKWAAGTATPDSISQWYEIGDISNDVLWHEQGLYYIGAKVTFNEKVYLCISQPAGGTGSGVDPVNWEYDRIDPSNTTYFIEIDTSFDRYIDYEQVGQSVIGTCISLHENDPRYSNSQPLNFREGREGIYVENTGVVINKVWVRYREEAPEFSASSGADSRIPKFLAPAIKTFAYKSWLIGDGQHEKSVLQDQMGYDLLVKELDRIELHQERGQSYRITREPYRRVNSRQSHVTEQTLDQIAALKSAAVNTVIKVLTGGFARNAVVAGVVAMSVSVASDCSAINAVKTGGTWVDGQEPIAGRFLNFPNGYAIPDGSGNRFSNNTKFQITQIGVLGNPPDITYSSTWIDGAGNTASAIQAITATEYPLRGTLWETYGRNDLTISQSIGTKINAKNAVKLATVIPAKILTFTGTPFMGVGIGFVQALASKVVIGTHNPSIVSGDNFSTEYANIEVGQRVAWSRVNLAGANMRTDNDNIVLGLVSPTRPYGDITTVNAVAIGAGVLATMQHPLSVGIVSYKQGDISAVRFKFPDDGATTAQYYEYMFGSAGMADFSRILPCNDSFTVSLTATAEKVREATADLSLSISTTSSALRERSGQSNISMSFLTGSNNGFNAMNTVGVASVYPIKHNFGAVPFFMWGVNSFSGGIGSTNTYVISLANQIAKNSNISAPSIYSASLSGELHFGISASYFPSNADQDRDISVSVVARVALTRSAESTINIGLTAEVSNAEVNPASYVVGQSTAIINVTTSAEALAGKEVQGESTAIINVTTGASGILNPLDLNWDALTDSNDGMLYPAQMSGGILYYSFKTNYKRLMWLDDDQLTSGTYQLKITPFATRASDGVDIQPYLALAGQLRFALTNDTGSTPASATVQRQASGNPYNVVTYTGHSAAVNNSNSYCEVPINSSGLVARGAANGQDGFSFNHAVARDASNQHISNSIQHTFNIVISGTCGIYIFITSGSLAFREDQLSFTKIS